MNPAYSPDPASYFRAALSLKRSLRRNEEDAVFAASQGNEIVYIVDTNVFVFYAHLGDHYHLRLNQNFDYLVDSSPESIEVSKVIERLTAEFLFSGHLPGQKHPYNLISVQHFAEVMRQAERISRTFRSGRGEAIGRMEESLIRDGRRVQDIINSDAAPGEKLEDLAKIVPGAWVKTLNPALQFTHAMRRAFLNDPPALRPLDQNEGGRLASELHRSEVNFWLRQLPKERSPDAIEDDAATLATMVRLYRQDARARGPRANRKYLFITTDEAIAGLVRREAPSLGVPNFVRSPQDYLPLLNLSAMREALAPAGYTPRMKKQFQEVFITLKSALELVETAAADGVDFSRLLRQSGALSALQSAWGEVSQYVTVLNAHQLAGGAERTFQELVTFISSPAGVAAASEHVRDTVATVRERHLEAMLRSAIASLSQKAETWLVYPHRRVQIKLIGDVFGELIPDDTLGTFLDRVVAAGELPSDTVERLRSSPEGFPTQLITACLFVAAERWMSAAQFARRAQEMAGDRDERRPRQLDRKAVEAGYLHAVCLRFGLRREDDYRYARKLLRQNLTSYRGRQTDVAWVLRRIRDEVELASLEQTAVVMGAIAAFGRDRGVQSEIRLSDHDLQPRLLNSARRIKNALRSLEDAEPFDFRGVEISATEGDQLIDAIKIQCEANLLAAFIFERIVPGFHGGPTAVADAGLMLARMRTRIQVLKEKGLLPRRTPLLYCCIATILHETDLEAVRGAARRAATILEEVDLSSSGVPPMDILEYGYIRQWLYRRRDLLFPVTSSTPMPPSPSLA
jgi:hypothetical protein